VPLPLKTYSKALQAVVEKSKNDRTKKKAEDWLKAVK
jgi:hypothetical protein